MAKLKGIPAAVDVRSAPKVARPNIPEKAKMILWARAAGRCQYSGCNQLLIGDLISGHSEMNASYIAHIVAAEPDGPRGDQEKSPRLVKDINNLMLMCDRHHRLIDREDVAGHPEELLLAAKKAHEDRISIVTAIDEDKSCHVLRYAAMIGSNESPVTLPAIKLAMLPERYPADGDTTIDIGITGLELNDGSGAFWDLQIQNLRTQFREKLRGRFERGEIKRLGVFALAPIPLLIELGRLLSDITDAEVRQLLREPKGWCWQDADRPIELSLTESSSVGLDVALKLEISAPISSERVQQVLGPEVPIWSISANGANNDIIRRRDDQKNVRNIVRRAYEAIKARHGEGARVHLFPATPVSASVELGRVWMPKAHLPMTIYDQNRGSGGFVIATKVEQMPNVGVGK